MKWFAAVSFNPDGNRALEPVYPATTILRAMDIGCLFSRPTEANRAQLEWWPTALRMQTIQTQTMWRQAAGTTMVWPMRQGGEGAATDMQVDGDVE